MKSPSLQNNPMKAVVLKVTAVFLFMVMAALVKAATQSVPAGQALFFRAFFSLPVIIVWLVFTGDLREGLIPKKLSGHIWRGIFGTTSMGLTFAGLSILPLPEVTAIGYATPIFTVLLAAVFLGERFRLIRMTAVLMGLVGVMVVMWPRLTVGNIGDAATIGAIMVLIAAIMRALVQIFLRQMVKTEHTSAIVFWFMATAAIMSLFTIPFGWVRPDSTETVLLVSAGVIGGIAQILVTSGYRFGAASLLAPFDYTSMIFAILIGWVVFAELPTSTMLIGSLFVIAGGALIIWRERQLGLERRRTRSVTDPKG